MNWQQSAVTESPTGWWKATTPGFTLYSDHHPELARRSAEAVATELVALSSIMGKAPLKRPRAVFFYVMRDGLEFEGRFGNNVAGVVSNEDDAIRVIMYGEPERWRVRQTLKIDSANSFLSHELAHVVLAQYMPHQPRWFAEGLAQFLETYEWNSDATGIELGRVNLQAYKQYRAYRSVGLIDVAKWGEASLGEREAIQAAHYGYSWALTHYLIYRDPKRFAHVVNAVGTAERSAPDTLAVLFEGIDPAELDRNVYGYMTKGNYDIFLRKVETKVTTATLSPVVDAELVDVKAAIERVTAHYRR